MKKKLTVLLAGVLCLTSFAVGAMSKGLVEKIEAELRGDFEIVVDGKRETFKNAQGEVVYPILYNGTTYLPVRAIGELMEKTVYWYQDEKRIELVDRSEESLVTDADVIVDGVDKVKPDKVKEEKPTVKTEADVKITLEEAKEIVLKKAGLKENEVVFTKAKLDRDDGRLSYEIDFKTDKVKYDSEVDALTGEVVEWEVEEKAVVNAENNDELITKEAALAVALKKAGVKEAEVTHLKVELDRDDGKVYYEIEFRHENVEYEAEIDAVTGNVLKWEIDR